MCMTFWIKKLGRVGGPVMRKICRREGLLGGHLGWLFLSGLPGDNPVGARPPPIDPQSPPAAVAERERESQSTTFYT